MGLYVIGDTHLALGVPKEMDIFGGNWVGYMDKLKESLYALKEEDTLVLCGDMCWGMTLMQSLADFQFLAKVPATILLLKGNHDYWWTSLKKMEGFLQEQGITNMKFIHNNAYFYEDIALCGTRGWFFEEDRGEHSEKIFRRELIRLETSLKAGGDLKKYCFFHYPPRAKGYVCEEIMALLKKYEVSHCFFGHLHGKMHHMAVEGLVENCRFHLVSADFLDCKPKKVI